MSLGGSLAQAFVRLRVDSTLIADDTSKGIEEGAASAYVESAGVAAVTPDEHQRLLLGLLLAAHDGDERAFRTLTSRVARPVLLTAMRNLAEAVVSGQLAMEENPGAARVGLAREALNAAAR
jgi:hypothetical protein